MGKHSNYAIIFRYYSEVKVNHPQGIRIRGQQDVSFNSNSFS